MQQLLIYEHIQSQAFKNFSLANFIIDYIYLAPMHELSFCKLIVFMFLFIMSEYM